MKKLIWLSVPLIILNMMVWASHDSEKKTKLEQHLRVIQPLIKDFGEQTDFIKERRLYAIKKYLRASVEFLTVNDIEKNEEEITAALKALAELQVNKSHNKSMEEQPIQPPRD